MGQPLRRAVWSFWSKPFEAHHHHLWFSEKHHLLAWILSFELARQYYPETVLVTDDQGARLLVDRLGLEFGEVSTDLNRLQTEDPDWWVLGKLWAYRQQTQPFVHIDADVFLWQPLPEQIVNAPVFTQSPEQFIFGDHSASIGGIDLTFIPKKSRNSRAGFRLSGIGTSTVEAIKPLTQGLLGVSRLIF